MDGEMMLGALVVLLLAVLLFLFWLPRCRRQRRIAEDARINAFAEDDQLQQIGAMKAARRKGLDKAMIEALPIFIYKSNEENESLENMQGSADKAGGACGSCSIECPVCLCEFQHKQKGRVLPNCKHRFHVDCIDAWLLSNATCPVCRASCGAGGDAEVVVQVIEDHVSIAIQYPTNVLFWGNNSRVSSRVSLDGLQQAPASSSIIQVYTHELPVDAASSPSSSSSSSPPSRISTLNPLRRLLSRERNGIPPIGTHSHIVFDSPSTHISNIPKV